MVDLEKLVEQVKDLVLESAKFTKAGNYSITEKEGESYNIVTSADLAVQEFLQKNLMALVPDSGFMGEEEGQRDNGTRLCWVVDPIDGTTNFARGMQQSGISVAFRVDGEYVLGVVYNPDLDDMFWAVKGKGAYLNGKRLSVSKKDFEHSVICTALCLYRKNYADICANVLKETFLKCADFRRFGVASLEICYVAAGRADLFFEFRLYPWDIAAAAVILREAGGVIGTLDWNDMRNVKVTTDLAPDAPSAIIAANNVENFKKVGQIVISHLGDFNPKEYN
ncbi:MAG: inositol monophosphatase [Spirochaetales bacterium]|nr:inositol monophosphatase [Spirochaetales bacterium]